ncbi:MAG: response regulator [Oligoflexia bacterium]|nr:response regulator [Oligoflexia bacterium]
MTQRPGILLVDDDERLRERLALALWDRGFEVRTAKDAAVALAVAESWLPARAVIDLRMPGMSGLELIRELKALYPSIEIVVVTGYGSIATAVDAVRLGAIGYVNKPADADEVLAAFERGEADPLASVEEPGWETPTLARAEWEHIQAVLAETGGNISEAARRLGLHRRTLQRKLQKRPPSD